MDKKEQIKYVKERIHRANKVEMDESTFNRLSEEFAIDLVDNFGFDNLMNLDMLYTKKQPLLSYHDK